MKSGWFGPLIVLALILAVLPAARYAHQPEVVYVQPHHWYAVEVRPKLRPIAGPYDSHGACNGASLRYHCEELADAFAVSLLLKK